MSGGSLAGRIRRELCAAGCLRQIAWPDEEDDETPRLEAPERAIPLLCAEACTFAVNLARELMAVPVPAAGPSQMGARVKLFTLGTDILLHANEWYTPFDVSPDDKRFLMSRLVSAADVEVPTFLLVENWFDEVRAKVGGK